MIEQDVTHAVSVMFSLFWVMVGIGGLYAMYFWFQREKARKQMADQDEGDSLPSDL